MKALIVYGTSRGQTARIADYIAGKLRNEGDDVDVIDGRVPPANLRVDRYDASIVGASVQAGRFQPYIVEFVERYRDQLERIPSAFFSVSMREAEPDPVKRAAAMTPIRSFLEQTEWQPDRVVSFAGSMAYLRRRWIMRLIWRRIPLPDKGKARRSDRDGTTTYEYTDWDAVSRFATEFGAFARSRLPAGLPA